MTSQATTCPLLAATMTPVVRDPAVYAVMSTR